MRIDIAAAAIEVANRCSKVKRRGRRTRGNGGGDGIAGEEPHFHELGGPLHGVDTTTVSIETIAVSGLIVGACSTAGSATSADSAIVSVGPAGLILKFHGAAGSSVGGDLVGGGHVDALDDVEFSVSRPGRVAKSPEGRPDTADRARHVFDVGEEETVVVVDLAFQAY